MTRNTPYYAECFVVTKKCFLLIILLSVAAVAGCISVPVADSSSPVILVTVPPMTEIVSAVAGDAFTVISVVPEGVSPHTYEPSPSDMASFGSADLWFTLGRDFLPFEDRVTDSLPDLLIIATGTSIRALAETGGEEGEMDPHIWLSAKNGILMTESVRDGLAHQYPELADEFSKNADEFISRLKQADVRLSVATERMHPKTFLTTHGSFGYVSSDYNITQLVITMEGKEPSARELAGIIDSAKSSGVRLIITEPLSGERTAAVLAEELGVVPVKIDTLSARYLNTLNTIAEVLENA